VFYSVFNGNGRKGADFMPAHRKRLENIEFSDGLRGGV
jgi:hypothetical protein